MPGEGEPQTVRLGAMTSGAAGNMATEWIAFEQHFTKNKVELGTCGRPDGSLCRREHACIRCPMLRTDPA